MNETNFWCYVLKTFENMPFKMKLVWLFAPPMALLVAIAFLLAATERLTATDEPVSACH